MSTPIYLSGFGSYSPAARLTNQELEARVATTSNEWIVTRTGIRERRMVAEGEQVSDMAAAAGHIALANAGYAVEDVSHIIVATCTPETLCPSTACITAHKLGQDTAMAFDISAACSGFLYGIKIGAALIRDTPNARLLLAGVEAITRRLNWQDRGTCVLFGDGAGAVVMDTVPAPSGLSARLMDVQCGSDCSRNELIVVGGGTNRAYVPGDPVNEDFFVSMQGREVFKHAVRAMTAISLDILEKNNMAMADVDLFVPHQANLRIIEAVGQRLGVSADKVFVNVESHGNTSAASVPLALADAMQQGRISPGMTVLLTTFGSGLIWSSVLLKFQ